MRLRTDGNGLVALGLGLALLAGAGCRGMVSEQPPIHLQQNMDQQRRLDPQENSAHWEDGRAMRLPPEGTVARGHLGDDAHLDAGRVDGDWAVEMPPQVPLSRALLERGRERYDIFCAPCHDAAGTGRGAVSARGFQAPPSLHDVRVRAMPVGQYVDIIANGVRNMPPYRAQVPVRDRWAIAAYIRALQISRGTSLADVPPDQRVTLGVEE